MFILYIIFLNYNKNTFLDNISLKLIILLGVLRNIFDAILLIRNIINILNLPII